MPDEHTVRPDPDPTIATKELIREAVKAAIAPLIEKLNGQQKAVEILAATQAKEPQASQVASDVHHLKELTMSELKGMKELFQQSVKAFSDLVEKINELNDKALKVLFDVNDKASLKAEASFKTQLEELGKRLELMSGTLTEKVAGLDKRFSTREGSSSGSHAAWGYVIAAAGLAVAAFTLIIHH